MSDWDAPGYVQCRKDREVQASIIADLQAENDALWEFVHARDAFNAMMDSGDWDGGDDVYDAMTATRDALRKYEQE